MLILTSQKKCTKIVFFKLYKNICKKYDSYSNMLMLLYNSKCTHVFMSARPSENMFGKRDFLECYQDRRRSSLPICITIQFIPQMTIRKKMKKKNQIHNLCKNIHLIQFRCVLISLKMRLH